MSIIYNDTQEKSELQRKILAELREKQTTTSLTEGASVTTFDDASNPDYHHEPMAKSTMWILILIAAVIASIIMFAAVM